MELDAITCYQFTWSQSVTLETEKHWRLAYVIASVKILVSLSVKVEMMVQIHRLENFLSASMEIVPHSQR